MVVLGKTRKVLLPVILVIIALLSGNGLHASTPDFTLAKASESLPPAPVAILWANDLDGLLERFDKSAAKADYFDGSSFGTFQKSKLYNKLRSRIKEMEKETGFGLSYDNLKEISGSESAIALYGISSLDFIFMTKLDNARFSASKLAKLREKFEGRRIGEIEYYITQGTSRGSSMAFALYDGLLITSNDVPLFEESLELLSGTNGKANSMAQNRKFGALIKDAKKSDIAIYLDMENVLDSVYFRTYWIYPDRKRFDDLQAALIGIEVDNDKITENRRYLWPEGAGGNQATDPGVLAKVAPPDAHYMRVERTDAKMASNAIVRELASWADNKEAKELADGIFPLIESAEPVAMLSASKAERDETGLVRPDVFIALEFGKPDKLDVDKLQELFKSAWENRLFVNRNNEDWGKLEFRKSGAARGGMQYLDTPIFGSELLAVSVLGKGEAIALSTSADWLMAALKDRGNKAGISPDSFATFMAIDIKAASDAYISLTGDLALRPNWPDMASKELFCTNLSSLAHTGSLAASYLIVTTSPANGEIQAETAVYSLK